MSNDTLTYTKLRDAMKELERLTPANTISDPFRLDYLGMKIIEAPEHPVLKLRDDFEWCSEEFRSEMNAWLLDRFGTRSIVPKGTAYVFSNMAIMNPRDVVCLRNWT